MRTIRSFVPTATIGGIDHTRESGLASRHRNRLRPRVIRALPGNAKGDPLEVARIAGISAAKKTSELIPLCHQLPLTHAGIEFRVRKDGIEITATASTFAKTGVEMEAMTAASVAALTIYDMTKALDKEIEIREVHLVEKTGGKSGTFRRMPRS